MKVETSEIKDAYAALLSGDSKNTSNLNAALKKATNHNIEVKIVDTGKSSMFVMCISPDKSTVDKLVSSVTKNESTFDTMKEVWKKASSWRIDVDKSLFSYLNAEELTALTLHEIAHMIEGDSIPTRLNKVVQVGVANSKIGQKALLNNRLFSVIVKLPIASSCNFVFDKEGIKREMRADKLAVNSGYLDSLLSAMGKIESMISTNKANWLSSEDQNINDSINYANELLDNLAQRRTSLVKKGINDVKLHSPFGSFLYESADEINHVLYYTDKFQESRDSYIANLAKKVSEESYITEFGFGKNMDPITRDQISYIQVKVESIKTINDKLMILSYINSKLELAEYYKSILLNKKMRKKYKIPHTLESLDGIIAILEKEKLMALKTKLPDAYPRIVVGYPTGYEG